METKGLTVTAILADLLRMIPAKVRYGLLVVFAVLVVGAEIARIVELELPYDKIDRALLLVGGYLGIQSAVNVDREKD